MKNLLPYDGELYYQKGFFDNKKSSKFYSILQSEIDWKNDEVYLFGKKHITDRKTAWYGDDNYRYNYSGISKVACLWHPILLEIKLIIEAELSDSFNSCLLNYYANGNQGMGWHADNEKELKPNGAIAFISLGEERRFLFKNRTSKEKTEMILGNGSLTIMKGIIQQNWLHALPLMKRVAGGRISLTYRTIIN